MNTIADERTHKAKQFRELWLNTWALTFGDEWVSSTDMWKLKESISNVLGNWYSVKDAQQANDIDTKYVDGITHYKLNNPS